MTGRARRLAIAMLLVAGCDAGPSPPVARTLRDWRGKDIAVPARPERIVSIVPSATELLFAVGAGGQIAGVTTYCTYPPEAARLEKIGDVTVSLERLRALDADLVIASWGLTRRSVEIIEEMGIPVFCVDPPNLADIARALRVLGDLTGHTAEGEAAAAEVERRLAAVEARVRGRTCPTVVLEMTSAPHVAVPGTPAHDVIVRAGGRNAFDDLSGSLLAPVSWETVVARDPEVYVVAHAYEPRPSSRPGFDGMRAARNGRVLEFDFQYFMFPTPRLVRGLELLAEALHP